MSLQQCHECKKDVSSEAKLCPNCGAPVKKPTSILTKIVAGFFLFILFMAFIGLMVDPSTNTHSTPSAGINSSTQTPTSKVATKTATDEQIYRELEVCMNSAKKEFDDNKLEYQRQSSACLLQLKKYEKKQAARVFKMYFDLNS